MLSKRLGEVFVVFTREALCDGVAMIDERGGGVAMCVRACFFFSETSAIFYNELGAPI